MSSFTACVWIGSVMMRRVSSTSMTSISGVVFISTITSPSPLSLPTFIAMGQDLYAVSKLLGDVVARFEQEADLLDAGDLRRQNDTADRFETDILVAADMHFRQRMGRGDGTAQRVLELVFQFALIDRLVVVINVLVLIDRDDDVFRLRDGRDVLRVRKLDRHR